MIIFGVGVYICGENLVFLNLIEGKMGWLCVKLLYLVDVGLYL